MSTLRFCFFLCVSTMGILYKHGMEFGMWVEVLGHGFGRMVLGMLPLQPAGLIQFYSFSSTVAGS